MRDHPGLRQGEDEPEFVLVPGEDTADGKPIYEAKDLKVGLFKSEAQGA